METKVYRLLGLGITLMLCGCATREAPSEVVVDETEAMTHIGPGIRPETLLFPEYLFLPDFELQQQGPLPGSNLIGIELKAELDLQTTRQRYADVLAVQRWRITQEEGAAQSFRLLASRGSESIEIRAVRGTGPVQVFILYRPPLGNPR